VTLCKRKVGLPQTVFVNNNYAVPGSKKMGRPKLPGEEARGELFSVRVNPGEALAIRLAISESGKAKPEWLREALLKAAKSK